MWTWDRKDSDVAVWGTRVTPKGCDEEKEYQGVNGRAKSM